MPESMPPILTTDRLTLRPLREGDGAALFAIFSDPDVVRYWSRSAWTDMAQADDMLAAAANSAMCSAAATGARAMRAKHWSRCSIMHSVRSA